MGSSLDVAVDVGGTFTDFVVREGEEVRAFKRASTPAAPERVLLEGLAGRAVESLGHGTTVATNAVLEGRAARTALVTTAGFEDLLIIGRQNRPSLYDLRTTRPDPLVPRELTFGVEERVDAEGRVLRPLEPQAITSLRDRLKKAGAESVALSLLFSFKNPEHETLVAEGLREAFHVSLSSQVLPEFREYERTATTTLDALVGPLVGAYLSRVEERLEAPVYVMRSNGGLREASSLRRRPVETVLSGPAGGVAGATFLAEALGLQEVMTLDMGGTSADLALLHEGEPTWTTEAQLAGHPLALPVLDIATIGAGGGSVAWLDPGGALQVGPRSAGADPGPLCYARGGADLTLTDVDLVSGLLGEELGGGELRLRPEHAEGGVTRLQKAMGLDREETLTGVRRVVVSNMVRAAALNFARRGLDPRDFALLAFGGAGPMHALDVARELGMREVIVPPLPGAFSAYGILVSDVRLDYGKSLVRPLGDAGEEVEAAWEAMEAEGRRELEAQGFPLEDALLLRSLDLRYEGQSYEVNVAEGADVEEAFHRAHDARFGYAMPEEPVEVVTVRLTALVRRPKPWPRAAVAKGEAPQHREALFAPGWSELAVHDRERLPPGFEAAGPLIVQEATATTVVDSGARLRVDERGCLRVEVG